MFLNWSHAPKWGLAVCRRERAELGKVVFTMAACAFSPSCLGRSRLLVVMPTVARLLLLFQLLQAFGFAVAEAALAQLPVILAVLVDQAHLRLA